MKSGVTVLLDAFVLLFAAGLLIGMAIGIVTMWLLR